MQITSSQEISLYFHVPFCTKKCAYCHFYVIPDKDPYKKQLMEGFALEWDRVLPLIAGNKLKTIYFGGGTPSLLGAEAIETLLSRIYKTFEPAKEVTLEANPENISADLMHDYAAAGINRVSIGLQTLDNQILKKLGRLHSGEKAVEAVYQTFDGGIKNISIDLMYDLPHQTLLTWENTLTRAIELPITHLSLYNLTIEPHTVFFKHQKMLQKVIPDEETSLKMYEMAIDMISPLLPQYEISAFAKQGCESLHNVGYWIGRPFWGFGPSAFSYFKNKRFSNVANLSRYHKALVEGRSPITFEEELDSRARRRELLTIHIRLIEGVDLVQFEAEHGLIDQETTVVLERLAKEGFIEFKNTRVKLTRRGVLFYDTVATEIV